MKVSQSRELVLCGWVTWQREDVVVKKIGNAGPSDEKLAHQMKGFMNCVRDFRFHSRW